MKSYGEDELNKNMTTPLHIDAPLHIGDCVHFGDQSYVRDPRIDAWIDESRRKIEKNDADIEKMVKNHHKAVKNDENIERMEKNRHIASVSNCYEIKSPNDNLNDLLIINEEMSNRLYTK